MKKFFSSSISSKGIQANDSNEVELEQIHHQHVLQSSPPERRQKFAFMRQASPSRRKISSTTLEKTREHAKRLAMMVGSPVSSSFDNDINSCHNSKENNGQHRMGLSKPVISHLAISSPSNHVSRTSTPEVTSDSALNNHFRKEKIRPHYATFDTTSIVSGSSSAYDMDVLEIPDDSSSVFLNVIGDNLYNNYGYRKKKTKMDKLVESQRNIYSKSDFVRGDICNEVIEKYNENDYNPQKTNGYFSSIATRGVSTSHGRRHSNPNDPSRPFVASNNISIESRCGVSGSTFPRNSTMRGSNNSYVSCVGPGSTISTGSSNSINGAAARRLMRRSMGGILTNNKYSVGTSSVVSDAESDYSTLTDSFHDKNQHSKDSLSSLLIKRCNLPPRSPVVLSSDITNKKIIKPGFSFDAFGLDANEIDDEVSVALAELADSHPDIELFLDNQQNQHKSSLRSLRTSSSPSTTTTVSYTASPNFISSNDKHEYHQGSDSSSLTTPIHDSNIMCAQRNMLKKPQNRSLFHQTNRVIRSDQFTPRVNKMILQTHIPQSEGRAPVSSFRNRFESNILPDISADRTEASCRPVETKKLEEMRSLKTGVDQPILFSDKNNQRDDDFDLKFVSNSHWGSGSHDHDTGIKSDVHFSDMGVSSDIGISNSSGILPEIFVGKVLDYKNTCHQLISVSDHKEKVTNTVEGHFKESSEGDNFPHRIVNECLIEEKDKEFNTSGVVSCQRPQFLKKDLGAEFKSLDRDQELYSTVLGMPIKKDIIPLSHKRAQEWATARTSPVTLSPLLNPQKLKEKKQEAVSISQKRAKEWAAEAPKSPAVRLNPHLIVPDIQKKDFFFSASQIRAKHWAEEAPSSPKACIVKLRPSHNNKSTEMSNQRANECVEVGESYINQRERLRPFLRGIISDVVSSNEEVLEIKKLQNSRIEKSQGIKTDIQSVQSMSDIDVEVTSVSQKGNNLSTSKWEHIPSPSISDHSIDDQSNASSHLRSITSPTFNVHKEKDENDKSQSRLCLKKPNYSLMNNIECIPSLIADSPLFIRGQQNAEGWGENQNVHLLSLCKDSCTIKDNNFSYLSHIPSKNEISCNDLSQKNLRRSSSPSSMKISDPDRFRAYLPTVPLRKAPPRPTRDIESDSEDKPHFLANIKLRKTAPLSKRTLSNGDSRLSDDKVYVNNKSYSVPDKKSKNMCAVDPALYEKCNNILLAVPMFQDRCYEQQPETYTGKKEQLEQEDETDVENYDKKTCIAPERDVAALIRRRIAANRRNTTTTNISSVGKQLGNIASMSPRDDLTSMRNRLKKVTKENQKKSNLVKKDFKDAPSLKNCVQCHDHSKVSDKIKPLKSFKSETIRIQNKSPHSRHEKQFSNELTSNSSSIFEENISTPYAISFQSETQKHRAGEVLVKEDDCVISDVYKLETISKNYNNISDAYNIESTAKDCYNNNDSQKISNIHENTSNCELLRKPLSINSPVEESLDSMKSNEKLLALFSQRKDCLKKGKGTQAEKKNDNFVSDCQSSHDIVENNNDHRPSLKDDPQYFKYFKMLKIGVPMDVVKHSMTRDKLNPDVMDGDHNKPAKCQTVGIPLNKDPAFSKYFKMLKIGLPMGAVQNAMERDGLDPKIMDGAHDAPAEIKKHTISPKKPKDNFRRTRLHWDTLRKVRSTSVWAMVNKDPDVEQIEIDENEFAELFQAEMQPKGIAARQSLDVGNTAKKLNAVKVIDSKRANNGGIILARLKMTYDEMASAVDKIDDTVMSSEQMQGIIEYIPSKEEKQALRKYMTASGKDSSDAFDELCECEKFMVAMMTVKHPKEKIRALLFKLQCQQCIEDLVEDTSIIEKACEELSNSVRLRKLLGIVLNLGNRLNTAGPSQKGKAGAFAIQSLLKLSQAKAFDKKTTFLQYVVMVVLRHNESLVHFKDDFPSVLKADKVFWDQCLNDLEEVENQLENVRKIALYEGQSKKRPPWKKKKKYDDEEEISQDSMTLEEEVESLRSSRIGIFTLDAIKKVSALREKVETTEAKFAKVLEYLGEEDNRTMQPHELFEIIVTFSKDFDAAKDDVASKMKGKLREHKSNQAFSKQAQLANDRILKISSLQPNINNVVIQEKPVYFNTSSDLSTKCTEHKSTLSSNVKKLKGITFSESESSHTKSITEHSEALLEESLCLSHTQNPLNYENMTSCYSPQQGTWRRNDSNSCTNNPQEKIDLNSTIKTEIVSTPHQASILQERILLPTTNCGNNLTHRFNGGQASNNKNEICDFGNSSKDHLLTNTSNSQEASENDNNDIFEEINNYKLDEISDDAPNLSILPSNTQCSIKAKTNTVPAQASTFSIPSKIPLTFQDPIQIQLPADIPLTDAIVQSPIKQYFKDHDDSRSSPISTVNNTGSTRTFQVAASKHRARVMRYNKMQRNFESNSGFHISSTPNSGKDNELSPSSKKDTFSSYDCIYGTSRCEQQIEPSANNIAQNSEKMDLVPELNSSFLITENGENNIMNTERNSAPTRVLGSISESLHLKPRYRSRRERLEAAEPERRRNAAPLHTPRRNVLSSSLSEGIQLYSDINQSRPRYRSRRERLARRSLMSPSH